MVVHPLPLSSSQCSAVYMYTNLSQHFQNIYTSSTRFSSILLRDKNNKKGLKLLKLSWKCFLPPVVQETPGLCNCHQTRNNPANNNYVSVLVFLLFGFCEPKWVLHCLFQIKVFFIAYLNKKPKRQGSVPIFSRLFLLDLDRTSRVCVGKITGLLIFNN